MIVLTIDEIVTPPGSPPLSHILIPTVHPHKIRIGVVNFFSTVLFLPINSPPPLTLSTAG